MSPRIHAIYNNSKRVMRLSPLQTVPGDATKRVCDRVLEGAAKHQEVLPASCYRCVERQSPAAIAPLDQHTPVCAAGYCCRNYGFDNCEMTANVQVVDTPFTSGTNTMRPPEFSTARRSSAFNVSKV